MLFIRPQKMKATSFGLKMMGSIAYVLLAGKPEPSLDLSYKQRSIGKSWVSHISQAKAHLSKSADEFI